MQICIIESGNITNYLVALNMSENETNILFSSFFDVKEYIEFVKKVA